MCSDIDNSEAQRKTLLNRNNRKSSTFEALKNRTIHLDNDAPHPQYHRLQIKVRYVHRSNLLHRPSLYLISLTRISTVWCVMWRTTMMRCDGDKNVRRFSYRCIWQAVGGGWWILHSNKINGDALNYYNRRVWIVWVYNDHVSLMYRNLGGN